MTEFIQILFWVSLWLTFYIYLGYFILIWLISRFYPEIQYEEPAEYPKISMIIAAYNEEKVIEQKIQNCLSLDYPPELLEILIGSDGSTDKTAEIILSFRDSRMSSYIFENHSGKNSVLNKLVPKSSGSIIVFSDANILLQKNTLKFLVAPFQNESTGVVNGKLQIPISANSTRHPTEKSYWSAENALRRNETKIGTTFGVIGAIYAIRRSLVKEIPTDISVIDDTFIKMSVLERGFNIVHADNAIATETVIDSMFIEMKRRMRICARNLNGVRYYKSLMNPRNGYIALGIWSHKILRWLAPFPLIVLLLTSFLLKDIPFYHEAAIIELAVIIMAFFGIILNILKIKVKYLTYAAYFFVINFGLLVGFFKFLLGTQKPYWEPTDRP